MHHRFMRISILCSTFLLAFSLTGLQSAHGQAANSGSNAPEVKAFNQWWPWPAGEQQKAAAAERLPTLKVQPDSITVSGISAGAYMATQLQIAYSATFAGAGSVAGGPWNCADGTMWKAQSDCMNTPANVDVGAIEKQLLAAEKSKDVDSLDNLKTARLYLYNSDTDAVVRPPMRKKNTEFFEKFVPRANIRVEQDLSSAHGFPTVDYGVDCGQAQAPYLMKCNYDTAGEILKQMYPGTALSKKPMDAGSLYVVDQTEFADENALLAQTGWLYVPVACEKAGANCRLHVALHGCLQSGENIKDIFAIHAGYNDWAEGSKIVILYPQARKSMMNPNACFDWFGYTGPNYALKSGRQMTAIKAMIDRLVGP